MSKIYLQQNEAVLHDDFFSIFSASNHKFFNVEKAIIDTYNNPLQFVGVGLMLSPNKNNYSRSVFTIMGLIGNVGGVYGLLQSVWGVLVGLVSSQILMASVFRRLYYTNKTNSTVEQKRDDLYFFFKLDMVFKRSKCLNKLGLQVY